MSLLDKLERRLGRYHLPNLALLLTFGQGAFFILLQMGAVDVLQMIYVPALVLRGEVWRLATFVFVPPCGNWLLYAFGLYLFFIMSTALEEFWGGFRFNLYILIGYALTVAAAFFTPAMPVSALFIGGSVFLAFAFLNPDFVLNVMFVLPMKVKWLAWIMWIGYGAGLIQGPLSARLTILASVANFLVFFWRDLLWLARRGGRQVQHQARGIAERRRAAEDPFHRCAVCGVTDQTHPHMLFRYCRDCAGNPGYCEEHFKNHEHVRGASVEGRGASVEL